ncbi:hypothetical protein KOR34_15130 [Posidoniimonas corsicana]|uniref:Uncharacterized protein n=1 Tax=Posidoniimonas corsicana TaxID=1938618 RepID=A0A5C5VF78_9BACT|nr:hypothetical protein [Posidoniimonas corsicana]TWT36607.1 hypothetical protein KOR34_15130 [Posidoniimonas corsicana]
MQRLGPDAALVPPLFVLFARSSEDQLRRQILFLKTEPEMTRASVPQSRIFFKDDERQQLLELGDGIGADVLKMVLFFHPRSYRRWQERRRQGKPPAKKIGRKGTSKAIRQIVVRPAKQNRWGYGRIVGESRELRIRCVGRTTASTILKEEGIYPGPKRGPGTWDDFIKIQAESLWQCDFFSKMARTSIGLRQAYTLAFLHVRSVQYAASASIASSFAAWDTSAVSRLATSITIIMRGLTRGSRTSRCSGSAPRSTIRQRAATRSSAESGLAAC